MSGIGSSVTWTSFVKGYAKEHGLTYGQALHEARGAWREYKDVERAHQEAEASVLDPKNVSSRSAHGSAGLDQGGGNRREAWGNWERRNARASARAGGSAQDGPRTSEVYGARKRKGVPVRREPSSSVGRSGRGGEEKKRARVSSHVRRVGKGGDRHKYTSSEEETLLTEGYGSRIASSRGGGQVKKGAGMGGKKRTKSGASRIVDHSPDGMGMLDSDSLDAGQYEDELGPEEEEDVYLEGQENLPSTQFDSVEDLNAFMKDMQKASDLLASVLDK